jgi:phage anti-repressor protein/predicted GIY-YIG superfamily endonuclease
MSAKVYIKRYTTVPESFVDELFEFYEETTSQTDFVIKLSAIAKWLNTHKQSIVTTLKRSYKIGFDYIVTKPINHIKKDPRSNHYKEYMLSPDCFKRVCMLSKSGNAEMVRTYFIEVEKAFLKYRMQTEEGMKKEIERLERNQRNKAVPSNAPGYIYIIRASTDKDNLYKIGRTKDLQKRLRNYNTGNADDVEVLYVYRTDMIVGTESCVKAWLKEHQYRKYKEVYQADLDMIKKLIESCGEMGAKIMYKKRTTTMKGGYYVVFDEASDASPSA